MREILFRGKRVDNGEWVYGLPYERFGEIQAIRFQTSDGDNIGHSVYAVDTDTVGQYTGLIDKNGKKIFEGDIVLKRNYNGKETYPVKFDGGMFYAGIGGGSSTATHRYTLEDRQIEVIGNIYDKGEG